MLTAIKASPPATAAATVFDPFKRNMFVSTRFVGAGPPRLRYSVLQSRFVPKDKTDGGAEPVPHERSLRCDCPQRLSRSRLRQNRGVATSRRPIDFLAQPWILAPLRGDLSSACGHVK